MWENLENALAWYQAAPTRWMASAKQDLSAAAEWIWIVLQGDFAEDQTAAQVVTGTIISMIPLVDQICDVRDVVANCKKINQDSSNRWSWVALALTLIGLFPTLGSLVKGCFKVMFAYGRKSMFQAGKAALDADMWKASKPFVEKGIGKLNDFLARPEVRKTLKALKIDNPYRSLADQLRNVSGSLSVGKLTSAFDTAIAALNKLLDLVKKWGSAAMQTQAGQLLQMVKKVREQANKALADVLAPVQNYLNRLAQRLDVERRVNYSASTNVPNPHGEIRMGLDAELAELRKAPPSWVTVGKKGKYPETRQAPSVPASHFDIGDTASQPLKGAYATFHGDIIDDILPPGTVLYRVLGPKNYDNAVYWMSEAEFKALHSKPEWRERFAVWKNWNANGEYLTYTVPPGQGMPVWRGKAASQRFEDKGIPVSADNQGNFYWLEGGHEQIAVNPKLLDPKHAGQREFTGWGYDDSDIEVNLIGVPILESNWK
ncbi:MAG: hypothetical protein HYU74_11835 [Dechloromonas sp.]|nr:hypothetical protein [Dechloromonas sp.]